MVMEMEEKGKGGVGVVQSWAVFAVVYWLSFHHSWFKKV